MSTTLSSTEHSLASSEQNHKDSIFQSNIAIYYVYNLVDFLVGDLFNLELKGSVNANFLRNGVSRRVEWPVFKFEVKGNYACGGIGWAAQDWTAYYKRE
ncbi:hypothetical protein K443DRAFT_4300 [Laccaria amethystina LaAM-08-1]|uniref:Uncharacterized protein n=1 Tax=Laccaria amethystina LaAM-08-1 TaxID=1095629 RepID=A0A0C9XIB0_9AGAR|nr:hypothetical protein K443DRAFT_4300 [Laccaria amethystina LaAM-08-1]